MGVVFTHQDADQYELGEGFGKSLVFKRGEPVHNLPKHIEEYCRSLGYFRYVPDPETPNALPNDIKRVDETYKAREEGKITMAGAPGSAVKQTNIDNPVRIVRNLSFNDKGGITMEDVPAGEKPITIPGASDVDEMDSGGESPKELKRLLKEANDKIKRLQTNSKTSHQVGTKTSQGIPLKKKTLVRSAS